MKLHIGLIIFFLTFTFLEAEIDFFRENYARISQRNYIEISIPMFNNSFYFNNSLLRINDLQIFQENNVLKNSDKRKLTSGNMNVKGFFRFDFIDFGYENYQFKSGYYGYVRANLLKKDYAKIIFYGNELDKVYEANSGKNSSIYTYFKTSIKYGIPGKWYLNDYISNTSEDRLYDRILSYFLDSEIIAGVNINFYFPHFIAEVMNSSQTFYTSSVENYYDYVLEYAYLDEFSTYKGRLSPGLGFALQFSQEYSNIYFSVDDLFARIKYEDLAYFYYEGSFVDSLLYFDDSYEPWDQSVEIDSLSISRRNVRVKPAVTIGGDYSYTEELKFALKYKYRDLELINGFSAGVSYKVTPIFSPAFQLGKENHWFYNLILKLHLERFSVEYSNLFYHGLFGYAKGFGFDLKMKYKF